MRIQQIIVPAIAAVIAAGCDTGRSVQPPHYADIKTRQELYEYFRYSPDRDILVSGHRGGMMEGYPENCIASFENTLSMMESFFEIDPRLTKDSVIVLMHDRTIDRTTTGSGKLSDYTLAELAQFDLLDRDGNPTPYKIPTLAECIEWSRGKTILNLDIKDVPIEFMSDFIASLDPAPANIMYTVRDAAQAKRYYDRDNGAMFSCWCQSQEEFDAYEAAGIPWRQAMAYVGPQMTDDKRELCARLRAAGVMCMISVAPTHDKKSSDEEKTAGYETDIATAPDVIETDYPYLFTNLSLKKRHNE